MPRSPNASPRWSRLLFDLLFGTFLFGLFLLVWLPPGSASSAPATSGAPTTVTPVQGTGIILNTSGSISTTDLTFNARRHFRSGIPGDRNCQVFGAAGPRYYDQYFFYNSSPSPQKVSVVFTSNCGANTYEAAYSPSFNPADICANYLAGAGASGSTNWDFIACGNSTFSILVYGLEPGVTCGSYQLVVGGSTDIGFTGSTGSPPGMPVLGVPGGTIQGSEGGPFTRTDATRKRLKRADDAFDARHVYVPPPEFVPSPDHLLPQAGTTLVASINGSLDASDQTFTGPQHFRSGTVGDANCFTQGPVVTHLYDQYFFMNDSPVSQRITVSFTSSCGFTTYEAAYSPQFDPTSICTNYLAGAGRSGDVTWQFTVCPNTQFSLVVYNLGGFACPSYTLQVYGENVRLVGTQTDVAVTKTGPAGTATASGDVTYNITVSNNGPATASNVVLTDMLPPGTTFESLLLTSPVAPGSAPQCTTPPPGGTGTITCTIPTLPAVPGTGMPTSLQFELALHAAPGATLTNTATVSFQGVDPNPANNTSTTSGGTTGGGGGGGSFDICLQDDAKSSTVLLFNSQTGDYRFCCNGTVVTGRGTVITKGSIVTLDHLMPDRRVQATVDRSAFKGSASLQSPPGKGLCTISDRDIRNNTCTCP